MAVYTHVDERTLAHFLADYNIGKARSFKGIAEGVENSNYLLETEKTRLILTLYEKRATPEDLPYFLHMMEHLSDAGLPAPRPIKDRQGHALKMLKGRPACLISFLSGVSVDYPDENHCAALGTVLGRMHNAFADFEETRANDLSIEGWQKLAKKTHARAHEIKPGLANLIAGEIDFLSDAWPTALPSGPIHADLFPDNVLFTDYTVSGLIDFYFGCTDIYAYDIAVCINAWCFDNNNKFRPENAKRLIEMYDAERPLSGAEIAALPVLCRGAAMRFMLTRLYDWLNPVAGAVVRPKDPLEYLTKLNFHQNVKDAASYVV